MTPPAHPFRTAVALAVILLCAVAVACGYWKIHALIFEIYALTALFIAFRAAPPIARWMATVPAVHRAIFYVLMGAVVAGHLFSFSTRTYFPFVAWDIFSSVSEQETVFCRELVATTQSGKQVRLVVEQLFPSIIQFDLPRNDEPSKMSRLVEALTKAYNQHHPADPVREVDLMLMAVKIHLPPGETRSQPSCELLQRFDLSSAPSS